MIHLSDINKTQLNQMIDSLRHTIRVSHEAEMAIAAILSTSPVNQDYARDFHTNRAVSHYWGNSLQMLITYNTLLEFGLQQNKSEQIENGLKKIAAWPDSRVPHVQKEDEQIDVASAMNDSIKIVKAFIEAHQGVLGLEVTNTLNEHVQIMHRSMRDLKRLADNARRMQSILFRGEGIEHD